MVVLAAAITALAAAAAMSPLGSLAAGENTPKTGIGVVRFDFGLPNTWLTRRYSYVLVGPSEVDRVKRFRGLALIYKAGMDLDPACTVSATCRTGVTYREARRNGWALKSAAGSEITHDGNRLGDVGNKAFQKRWLLNVAGFLTRHHAKAVFIDGASANVDLWSGGVFPAKYPTNRQWQDAMASFLAYVGPRLKNLGIYVVVSTLNYIKGDARTNDGTLDVRWWRRIGPYVSGLAREWWQQNPSSPGDVYTENSAVWTGHWSGWQRLVNVAQAMGRDFFGIQWSGSSDLRMLRYGRASFLLQWDGGGGAYLFAARDRVDPSATDWAAALGRPLRPRQRVGVGWKRVFAHGIVLLNPSGTTSQTFNLGGRYRVLRGPTMSSATLSAATALILTKVEP